MCVGRGEEERVVYCRFDVASGAGKFVGSWDRKTAIQPRNLATSAENAQNNSVRGQKLKSLFRGKVGNLQPMMRGLVNEMAMSLPRPFGCA